MKMPSSAVPAAPDNTIPLIIGVTGHRKIRKQDQEALALSVKTELQKLQALCPHSQLVMLSSLAEGADLLCADVAERLGISLIAVLPREREEYEKDFSPEALERFIHHCHRAEEVFVAPFTEAIPEGGISRNYTFRQAGIYVASHSHVLLALWDGGPGTEAACGTAETVDFALSGRYYPASGVSLRTGSNEAVIHVFTPRGDRTSETAGAVHLLGEAAAIRSILCQTDDFNRLAGAFPLNAASRLPSPPEDDSCLERLERIGRTAGKLSARYAGKYRCVLALLAVMSALLTFSFLMYDVVQATGMILACGFLLLGAWGCRRFATRSDCHRRYIEYRVLSECLRVQTYLRYAGSRVHTAEILPWTQQEETAWILDALCALSIGKAPETQHKIRSCWAEEQRAYHREAGKRSRRDLSGSEQIVRAALVLSIALYLAAVAFELLCGGLLFSPAIRIADAEWCRTLLKLFLGTISAVTLFIANYYGKLSLPRTVSDHRKMERFYEKMSDMLQQHGQTEELLTVLAREELIENGNWCSYQRDNTPDFSI